MDITGLITMPQIVWWQILVSVNYVPFSLINWGNHVLTLGANISGFNVNYVKVSRP